MSAEMMFWRGRIDPEPDTLRWHQVIEPLSGAETPGIALFGFRSDVGVRRNQGRPGSCEGPQALRRALSPLAYHQTKPLYDGGDISSEDGDLEAAQSHLANRLALALDNGHLPIVLGGGHEMAFGSWSGLAHYLDSGDVVPSIGIVNFDAHFDLRDPDFTVSSGTPFSQIAAACQKRRWPFYYACLGVSRASNTANLFARAEKLSVFSCLDQNMTTANLPNIMQRLTKFIDQCDVLYLTICLDVFPAAVAPGVSAPAARGVTVDVIEPLIELVRESGKLRLADIAELNPGFDVDARTARLAARLIHSLTL